MGATDVRSKKGSINSSMLVVLSTLTEKKREVYDMYGKDGVHRQGGGYSDDEFTGMGGHHGHFHFQFRSPEEIFRDFFGTDDPFSRIFGETFSPLFWDLKQSCCFLL